MNLTKASSLHCLKSAGHIALLFSFSVHWASAQNAQPTDEVLVQSGRLTQRQFDAPTSIYTIDAETIRSSGPQVNLSDVLARAPGVVALNRNNYAQDVQISVRGFGARSATVNVRNRLPDAWKKLYFYGRSNLTNKFVWTYDDLLHRIQ